MQASHEQIKEDNKPRLNSTDLERFIYQCAEEYSDCDKISAEQNKKRSEIRENLKAKGIATDAFLDRYRYYKKKRYEQDNFDDSQRICDEALAKAKNGELFSWMIKEPKAEKPKKEKKAA